MSIPELKQHFGKKIRRLRELKGIKQEALANQLGISQQAVSNMEQSEIVEEDRLSQIAKIFGITVDELKSFNEETVMFHIENMHDNSSANYQYNFNPIEKVVELYERLLSQKDEIIRSKEEIIATLRKEN